MLTLWLAVSLLKFGLCVLLWRTRQDRVYKYFTWWITFDVAEGMALLFLWQFPALYFYTYWLTAVVDVLFKLAVLVELFHDVIQAELVERAVVLRFYALIVMLGAVSFALALAFPSHFPVRLMAVIHTADAGACLMLCLIFIAILVVAKREGVYWLNRSLGIGYGLLLYLPLRAAIDVIEMPARRALVARFNYAELFAYLGALLIWVRFFTRPEIQPVHVPAALLAQYAGSVKRSE